MRYIQPYKPDYMYLAEFCRTFYISPMHLQKLISINRMQYETDRHGRKWIHISEGARLGLVRRNPPGKMPVGYGNKQRTIVYEQSDLDCIREIVDLVKALKAERDHLKRERDDLLQARNEVKRARSYDVLAQLRTALRG